MDYRKNNTIQPYNGDEKNRRHSYLLTITRLFIAPNTTQKILHSIVFVAFLIGGTLLTYFLGGTHLATVHSLYLPVIMAGLVFSVGGGLFSGILAGILVGPWMPYDVVEGVMQPTFSWAARLVAFACVGVASGLASVIFRSYIKDLDARLTTDVYTGLPNLTALRHDFETLTEQNSQKPMTLLVIDLIHLRDVDQAFGFDETVEMTRLVGYRLSHIFSEQAQLYRLNPGTFALLILDESDTDTVLHACMAELSQSYSVNGIPLFVEARYGLSRYPKDSESILNLVQMARMGAREATKEGAAFYEYKPELQVQVKRNLSLLHELKETIQNNKLHLSFQPIIDLKSNEPVSLETLVRWEHPELGRVSPLEFIPLAEETLLIHDMSLWIIERSLQHLSSWWERGIIIPISINLSVKNLQNPSFVNQLLPLIDQHNIPRHFVHFELTESAMAANLKKISAVLNSLKKDGIHIAIDDFGVGLSSLQYLLELSYDTIKIDKVFVQAALEKKQAATIIESIVSLAHNNNCKVTAEGIETQEQFDFMKKLGCDYGQGYWIAPPLEANTVCRWVESKYKNANSSESKTILPPEPSKEKFEADVISIDELKKPLPTDLF